MRNVFLLIACLGSVFPTRGQTKISTADEDRVMISVSINKISISNHGKEVTVRSNEALDSCLLKTIPGLDHPSFLLDAPNDIDRERLRTIGVILEKFHCPVTNMRKADPVKPALNKSRDTVGH